MEGILKKTKKYFNNKLTSCFKELNSNIDKQMNPIKKLIYKMDTRLLLMEENLNQINNFLKKNKKFKNIGFSENYDDKKNKTEVNKEEIKYDKIQKVISNKNNLTNIKQQNDIKNVRKNISEFYNIDINNVKKYLDFTNLISDVNFFKKLYLNNVEKEFYPIRNLDNRKHYQYWLNNDWHDDIGGEYIKLNIMKNIQKYYLKANDFQFYTNNMEQFVKNQKHINDIMDKRYQTKWLNSIKPLIKV